MRSAERGPLFRVLPTGPPASVRSDGLRCPPTGGPPRRWTAAPVDSGDRWTAVPRGPWRPDHGSTPAIEIAWLAGPTAGGPSWMASTWRSRRWVLLAARPRPRGQDDDRRDPRGGSAPETTARSAFSAGTRRRRIRPGECAPRRRPGL